MLRHAAGLPDLRPQRFYGSRISALSGWWPAAALAAQVEITAPERPRDPIDPGETCYQTSAVEAEAYGRRSRVLRGSRCAQLCLMLYPHHLFYRIRGLAHGAALSARTLARSDALQTRQSSAGETVAAARPSAGRIARRSRAARHPPRCMPSARRDARNRLARPELTCRPARPGPSRIARVLGARSRHGTATGASVLSESSQDQRFAHRPPPGERAPARAWMCMPR